MSAVGEKRIYAPQQLMSAVPPKADMSGATKDACIGPQAEAGPCRTANQQHCFA